MKTWEAPELEEIDMSAEIGSYQPDPDERGGEPAFVQIPAVAASQS
jgi:hypothetical protein